jgi:hypothetical protein
MSQPYRPPRPVTGIAMLLFLLLLAEIKFLTKLKHLHIKGTNLVPTVVPI